MRSYAIISPHFWIGETGRKLRAHTQRHQSRISVVAFYLLSNPHANMLGLYYISAPIIAYETGLDPLEVEQYLQDLEEIGFSGFDWDADVVWIYEMARFQIAESLSPKDNRVKSIQKEYEGLPKCRFLEGFFDAYAQPFHIRGKRSNTGSRQALGRIHPGDLERHPSGPTPPSRADGGKGPGRGSEGACKGLRSQEQDQEQDQEQPAGADLSPSRVHPLPEQNMPEQNSLSATMPAKSVPSEEARQGKGLGRPERLEATEQACIPDCPEPGASTEMLVTPKATATALSAPRPSSWRAQGLAHPTETISPIASAPVSGSGILELDPECIPRRTEPSGYYPPMLDGQPCAMSSEALLRATWQAYRQAYERHYGLRLRCSPSSYRALRQLLEQIPADAAPAVAAFYVGQPDPGFMDRRHPIADLLAHGQRLYERWRLQEPIRPENPHTLL